MTCMPYAAVVRRGSRARCARRRSSIARGEGVEASSSSSETANAVSASAVPRSRFVGTGARDAANARGFDVAETLARAREVCRRTRFEWRFSASLDETRRREETFRESGTRCWARMGFEACWRYTRDRRPRRPTAGRRRGARKVVQIRSAARVAVALACGAMRSGITPEEIEERMERGRERGVDDECVLGLLSRLEVNGFTIADDDHQRLGFGIYPDAALFNQSLVPNAQVMFAGTRLVIKALRDISPGEEVTIAYSEQYAPRERTDV